jgi:3-hydroxyisobutyrate dehydrogenase/glyoxylate/succinic semialdehyde reductase
MNIAFLGLGIMGSRMAANLLRAGHTLTVWNRSAEKAHPLVALGATTAPSPAAAVTGAEVIISMLSTPAAVEETALGEDGFLAASSTGVIWVDASTVNPSFSRRMAAQAAAHGLRFLDAPVTGSKQPAEKGQLRFLVGGATQDLESVRPLLEVMGSTIVHAGEQGMGASLKMIFNLMLGQAMLGFAEGMALGESLGIARGQLFDLLLGGPLTPPILATKRTKFESGEYEAEFPLQWMQKDLHLAALTAYEQGVAMPAVNLAKEIYQLAIRAGHGEEDFSAIYEFMRAKPAANE